MKRSLALCSILTLATSSFGETLSDKLLERERKSKGTTRVTAEIKAEFKEGIEAIKAANVVENALSVGDTAPDFTLKNALGQEISLAAELKKGPVILTWYRGNWCPYCNIALAAMEEELPEFQKQGAALIALTPELPDKTLTTKEKNSLTFEVLTDLNHQVADKYRLLFKLTPEVEKRYEEFFDLADYNGEDAGTDTLPLAATYIIGKDGKIAWAFLHHDYHKRAEPKDITAFLKKMNASSPSSKE
ncbi:MAG: peroxiredoxin-like family protein [Luteolibacter sp.]